MERVTAEQQAGRPLRARWLGRIAYRDAWALQRALGRVFRPFNRAFERATTRYVAGVRGVLRRSAMALAAYVGLLGITALGFQAVPGGFVPAQDKYYLVGIAQLPQGASLDRTEAVVRRMSEIAMAEPGVESVVAFPGLSINGFSNSPSAAVVFTMLDPFEQRGTPELSAGARSTRMS